MKRIYFDILLVITGVSLPFLIERLKGKAIILNDNFKLRDLSKILTIVLANYCVFFIYHKFFGMEIDAFYLYFNVLVEIAITFALIVAVLKYSTLKNDIKGLIRFPWFERRSALYILILFYFIIYSFISYFRVDVFPSKIVPEIRTLLFLKAIYGKLYLIPVLMLIEIFSIVGEEVVYRYFSINALRKILNKKSVIILSSLIWTFIHWPTTLNIFVLGILLGYLYYETESLSLCVTLHFIDNYSVLSEQLYVSHKNIGFVAFNAYQYAFALFVCQILLYHIVEIVFKKNNLQKQIKS